jgi:T4-like virus Myoviridae tail sheath stabiliser
MQFFYDGQVRRYVTQVVRVFSNFVVKYGDGSLHRIPVMYGDPDRQVASIIRQNSENVVNSVPRIAVYVSALSLDRSRLSDATFVDKVQIREREINSQTNTYTQGQGKNYTVERLMPTPFDLKLKVDIWSANTEQKLQILEQILVLFNPSLELQTTDNYIDWTSLTVLELDDIQWSSRQVPVGNDTPNEIATLTVHTPIWINPPVKVKHLGVITKIITSMHNNVNIASTYIDGLGQDPLAGSYNYIKL